MRKRDLAFISILMYLSSAVLLSAYAYFQISEDIIMTPLGRVFLLVISCIFMYIGAIILSKVIDKHKKIPFVINLGICFILYLLLLSTLTLFDDYFRGGSIRLVSWNREMVHNYLNNSFNIVPFKTISMYITRFIQGKCSTRVFMYNIVGNIVALMPFAFFLPLIFKRQNKFKNFLITMIIAVLLIEGIQFLTLSGSCDVDDLILNVGGACLLYLILSIKSIKSLIRNIFLLEDNEINYVNLVLNIILISIIFVILGILINNLINI